MASTKKTATGQKNLSKKSRAGLKAQISAKSSVRSKKEPKKMSSGIPSIKFSKRQSAIVVGVLLVAALVYSFKGVFVAAVVNGEPISRISLVSELEKKDGKQTLDTMVTKMLILQEAKKKNITVNQAEVDAEIKKISDSLAKQGQKLDDVLAAQGMTKQELEDQIRIQKIIEKGLGKDIKVTDKEVNDYIEKNKESLPQGMKEEELKSTVRQQLVQQKTSEKFQTWIADLKKQAKINYFVNF